MHDRTIEDRLRSTLRSEADSLPLTITADELGRRLALRRRNRWDRRVGVLAAGMAAIAIAGVFSLALGPSRRTDVANPPVTPMPSVAPSLLPSSPSVLPSSPEPTARDINPLGVVGEAVLVQPIGADPRRPEAFEVSVFDPAVGTVRLLATVPGSFLPDDGWIDHGDPAPRVSLSGYLALSFTRGPNEDESHPAIAVVDIWSPAADAQILDRYTAPMWGPTEHLAVTKTQSSAVEIFSVGSGHHEPAAKAESTVVAWSIAERARFVGTNGDAWGIVGFDGSFTAATDLPPVYQRSGRERPTGVNAHTLSMGCDSGPTGGTCAFIEWVARDKPAIRTWYTDQETVGLADHAWAVDGDSVLMLLTSERANDRNPVELVHASSPTKRTSLGSAALPTWVSPTILGIASEATAGRPTVTAIGDHTGRVFAFVLADGTVRELDGDSWFAGWADDPPPYDPD